MIFDSPQMDSLRLLYAAEPIYKLPSILTLDQNSELTDEKLVLENSICSVSSEKQRDWLGRLFSGDDKQYLSAWFEMMLLNWLKETGEIVVEPEMMGSRPDFLIRTPEQEIVIEAKAFLISQSERNQNRWRSAVFSIIETIQLPYLLSVKTVKLSGFPDIEKLTQGVEHWLVYSPNEDYIFQDRFGNIIVFESQQIPASKKAALLWSSEGSWVNPNVLKPALQEKAKAHTAIRRARYPYVIALFIESFLFSVEEVVDAWFGSPTVILDINQKRVIGEGRDRRGLHLYRKEISHRSVSGTLVFKMGSKTDFAGRILQGWFVENPYANIKVDSANFPVEASFVAEQINSRQFKMVWKNRS